MKELVPGIKVYGGSVDNVKGCTNKVENGDKLSLGDSIHILSLHTPWYVCLCLLNVTFAMSHIYSLIKTFRLLVKFHYLIMTK